MLVSLSRSSSSLVFKRYLLHQTGLRARFLLYNQAMSIKLSSNQSVPKASIKLGIAVAAGVVVGLAAGLFASWSIAPLAAWDTAVLTFVFTTWRRVLKFDAGMVKNHALREDPSRALADTILITASLASLAAVILLLIDASSQKGAALLGVTLLGVASVVASWLMVHTIYALKYAELYYSKPEGGVDFGQDNAAVYADFAYLAFTIGMTYQVSDTTLKSRQFRTTALKHALLSFLIGTVIIATTINFVAGLGK